MKERKNVLGKIIELIERKKERKKERNGQASKKKEIKKKVGVEIFKKKE